MDELAACTKHKNAQKRLFSVYGKRASIGISLLCVRSYWTRLWIFQEVMLARKIFLMCGSKTASWKPLRDLLVPFEHHRSNDNLADEQLRGTFEYQTIIRSPAMAIVPQTRRRQENTTLYNLMLLTRHLWCVERRDRVFALLGVLSLGRGEVTPVYTVPLPALINSVLRTHHEVQAPDCPEEVEKTCKWITTMLDVPPETAYECVDSHNRIPTPPEDFRGKFTLGQGDNLLDFCWASFYDHMVVADLLEMESGGKKRTHWLRDAVELGATDTVQWTLANRSGKNKTSDSLHSAYCRDTYQRALETASAKGYKEAVLMIVEAEMDPEMRLGCYEEHDYRPVRETPFGWLSYGRALCFAWSGGHDSVVRTLLDATKRFTALHPDRWRSFDDAFHLAAEKGNVKLLRVLLDAHTAPFDVKSMCYDDCGARKFSFAMRVAAAAGHQKIVQMLLDVDRHVGDWQWPWKTALHEAAKYGHINVVRLLLDSGDDSTRGEALYAASEEGQIEMVQLLLASEADANAIIGQGAHKHYALSAASYRGHSEIVRILIDAGADVNACLKSWQGSDSHALSLASDQGHVDIVRMLIDAGADVNVPAQTLMGDEVNAMVAASRRGHVEILQLLLDAGMIVNACNPLAEALDNGHEEAAQLLLAHGAIDTRGILESKSSCELIIE